MKIAVLGTGTVGRVLAGRLASLGHDTTIGTRDPAATMARTEADGMGTPPYPTWSEEHPTISLATFADTSRDAELVINASNGEATLEVLEQTGAENLSGKVLVDVSNSLDFSAGFPPSLAVSNTDS